MTTDCIYETEIYFDPQYIEVQQQTDAAQVCVDVTNQVTINNKGKDKGLDTCYSATYTSQTRDQQRFTISEVAADWHANV